MRGIVLLSLLAAIGCTGSARGSRYPGGPVVPQPTAGTIDDDRFPTQRGEDPILTVARKRVKAKEEPATLIAQDDTRCIVNASRFRNTRLGDYVTCSWM